MPTREAVIARHVAVGVYACMAGDRVGLHVLTAQGRVFVNIPVRLYRDLALAPRDANGRAWPVFHDKTNDDKPELAFIDLKPRNAPGQLTPWLEAAWQQFKADPSQTLLSLGNRLGLTASALSTHFRRRHGGEYRQLCKDHPRQGSIRTDETRRKIEQAFEDYVGGATVKEVSAKYNLSRAVLYQEFKTLRAVAAAVADRQPILKPTGTIL